MAADRVRRRPLRQRFYTAAIAIRAARLRIAIARRSSRASAPRPPWVVRAALMRSTLSGVRDPVLAPPRIRQRPFGIAGNWHKIARRVFAQQRGVYLVNSKRLCGPIPPASRIQQLCRLVWAASLA